MMTPNDESWNSELKKNPVCPGKKFLMESSQDIFSMSFSILQKMGMRKFGFMGTNMTVKDSIKLEQVTKLEFPMLLKSMSERKRAENDKTFVYNLDKIKIRHEIIQSFSVTDPTLNMTEDELVKPTTDNYP